LLPIYLGGVGGVLVEIAPKRPWETECFAAGNTSKLALVNLHLPSNAAN
jgi:hypothetical protein